MEKSTSSVLIDPLKSFITRIVPFVTKFSVMKENAKILAIHNCNYDDATVRSSVGGTFDVAAGHL